MKRKALLLFLFVFCGIFAIHAQTRQITGTVTSSEDGNTLPGVSIIVRGTTIGTITDFEGNYSLSVPSDADFLVFSFIGFQTENVAIQGRTVIDLEMTPDVLALEEVVITGLGVATDRRRVAISVESVSEEQLTRVPNTSLDGALIGRIAGAYIQSSSGQPGQQANIILRGINTLGSTQPMIMVDGVEISSSNNTIGTGNVSSRLSDLDLSNVERVEVVQGAAAATIYGAQGANGVIQIFTRKGRSGQPTDIRFSTNYSMNNALRGNLKFAENHYFETDADGFILGADGERLQRDPVTGFFNLPAQGFGPTTLNNKPFKETTYDHMDQYFVENAGTLNSSLNITGATDDIDFSFGLSHMDQESVVHGGFERYNLTSNIGSELFDGFTVRLNTHLVNNANTTGGINNRNNIYSGLSSALMVPQFVDLLWTDQAGEPYVTHDRNDNSTSPFYSYHYRDYEAVTNRIIQGVNANYELGRFIELDYKYGIDHYRYNYLTMIKNQTQNLEPGMGITPITGEMTKRRIEETQQNSILSANLRFDFEQDFGIDIPLQTTTQVAYDWRQTDYHRIDANGTGFDIDPPHTLNFADVTDADEYISKFTTFGYLVNQRFDYATLAGFSVGFRSDWSSEFGEAAEPFTFPRADAYFRLSELLGNPNLYELKLRTAYGEAGIQPGRYYRLIGMGAASLGEDTYMGLPSTSRNPALSVENTKEFEAGLDYGYSLGSSNWLNRVAGSLVYWTRNSYGTIYTIDQPPSTGATGILTNAIDLRSEGFQFSLDLSMVTTENFDWMFSTRFSRGHTIVDRISNEQPIVVGTGGSGQTVVMEGEPVGALFGLQVLTSLDQTNSLGERIIPLDEIGNYEIVEGMVTNINSKQVQFTDEQTKIGDATPKFNMSFFNDFVIAKNLSLSMQVDWIYGAQAYNQTSQWLHRDRLHSNLDREVIINGEKGAYVNFWESLYKTNMANDFFVEDASFIRLRNLSLSYDVSQLINIPWVKGLIVNISGQNLLTISDYTGIDPEATGTDLNDPLRRGTDLWAFPNMKAYNFGLNLNF